MSLVLTHPFHLKMLKHFWESISLIFLVYTCEECSCHESKVMCTDGKSMPGVLQRPWWWVTLPAPRDSALLCCWRLPWWTWNWFGSRCSLFISPQLLSWILILLSKLQSRWVWVWGFRIAPSQHSPLRPVKIARALETFAQVICLSDYNECKGSVIPSMKIDTSSVLTKLS